MEPITVVVGGVCLTGALTAAVARKISRRMTQIAGSRESSTGQSNVVPLHPQISYGFTKGTTLHPKDILLRTIREAERQLDIAIYTFTDLDIVIEMIRAHRRGVNVRLITDSKQSTKVEYQRKIISELVAEGILVKMNLQEDARMHLKIIIVDGKTIASGSFNFTNAAANKHEEVLVRIDDVAMARDWQKHFESMWKDKRRYMLHKAGGREGLA